MVTQNDQADQAAPAEEQAQEAQAVQEAPQEEAVDWKVRAEEAEQKAQKLEQDLKTQQGRDRRSEEWRTQLTTIGDRLTAMEQSNSAVIRAFSSGDTERLPQELSTIQQRAAQTAANRSYEERYAQLATELRDAAEGVYDLYNAPELEQERADWVQANKQKDIAGLHEVLRRVDLKVRSTERDQFKQTEEQIREEERTAAKKRLEEAGIYDLDTGPAAGGAGLSDMDFLAAWGADPDRYKSKEDRERADKILKNLR